MFVVFCFFVFKQKTAYYLRISYWSSDVFSSDLESNFRAFDIFAGSFGGNPMAPEIFRRSSCRAGPCKRVEDDFIWPAQEFDHLGCQRDRHASRMGRKAGVSACFGVSLEIGRAHV